MACHVTCLSLFKDANKFKLGIFSCSTWWMRGNCLTMSRQFIVLLVLPRLPCPACLPACACVTQFFGQEGGPIESMWRYTDKVTRRGREIFWERVENNCHLRRRRGRRMRKNQQWLQRSITIKLVDWIESKIEASEVMWLGHWSLTVTSVTRARKRGSERERERYQLNHWPPTRTDKREWVWVKCSCFRSKLLMLSTGWGNCYRVHMQHTEDVLFRFIFLYFMNLGIPTYVSTDTRVRDNLRKRRHLCFIFIVIIIYWLLT